MAHSSPGWGHCICRSPPLPQAQRFFDQGLRLLYAFNHAEAIRAFREAARLDPGWRWRTGAGDRAWSEPQRADDAGKRSARLRRHPAARAHCPSRDPPRAGTHRGAGARFAADGKGDRAALDRAYAGAMQKVADRFPRRSGRSDALRGCGDEHDAVGLLAEGRHCRSPRRRASSTVLETVIARHPDHAGALHYHIHLLEASADPDRAERAPIVSAR